MSPSNEAIENHLSNSNKHSRSKTMNMSNVMKPLDESKILQSVKKTIEKIEAS